MKLLIMAIVSVVSGQQLQSQALSARHLKSIFFKSFSPPRPSTFFVLQKSRVLTSKATPLTVCPEQGENTYYFPIFVDVDSLAMGVISTINTLPLDGEWLPFSNVGVTNPTSPQFSMCSLTFHTYSVASTASEKEAEENSFYLQSLAVTISLIIHLFLCFTFLYSNLYGSFPGT